MDHPAAESGETNSVSGGEIEIEKLPLHEVEIRRRELLPVFKQSTILTEVLLAGNVNETTFLVFLA